MTQHCRRQYHEHAGLRPSLRLRIEVFAQIEPKAIFAILHWVVVFIIPIGTTRSKQIPKSELWTAMRSRLQIVIALSFISGFLNATMSGTIGFYGGFLGAFLSWSWLLLVKYVATHGSKGPISPRHNAKRFPEQD